MSVIDEDLKTTALHPAHLALGARMVPFTGYAMPLQYEGVLAEHRWTRAHAGLFDVSHMGSALLTAESREADGEAAHAAAAAVMERLTCGDLKGLKRGQLRYTLLLDDKGGVLDDLMVGRPLEEDRQGELFIVVNAAGKAADFALIAAAARGAAVLQPLDGWSLLALQGPEAAAVLQAAIPGAAPAAFMQWRRHRLGDSSIMVSRSGYTGEDGFEISAPDAVARRLWDQLVADPRVRPIGLAARDSLRLEAGLPLYGHDLDETVSPIEAGLGFAVPRVRRARGDLPGAARLLTEIDGGPRRLRVGLSVLEGAPAREGAQIVDEAGAPIGVITSGGFSPSLGRSIALGFVPPALAAAGRKLGVVVRGKVQPVEVVALPFVPHRYVRQP